MPGSQLKNWVPATAGLGATPDRIITNSQLAPIVAAAQACWQSLGVDSARFSGLRVTTADLAGNFLRLARGNTITLDRDAAGWGWFVDATPLDDSEFLRPGNQSEQNRTDLLTVVMHEMGRLLGLDHDEERLMTETLAAGAPRTGLEHDAALTDQVVGQSSDTRPMAWLGAWLTE